MWNTPAVQRRRARCRRPSVGLGRRRPPRRVELGGQRGEPVGLVAADVGDAAQIATATSARARQRGDHRGQLADVVQVDVDAVAASPVPVTVRPVAVEASRRRPSRRGCRAARRRPGWSCCGQPRHGHRAAGDAARRRGTGAALDRSGSTWHVERADSGPARPASVLASPSSTSTPASRSIATVISMCGSDGHRLAVVAHVDALVEAGAGEQQRGDELARTPRRRSSTAPPRHRARGRAR